MRNQRQEARSKKQEARCRKWRRAFSLVEVLLAMFILGIGMIMVASVFPVGANWTRQTTEDSVSQTIVQDALTVLKTHYGPNGNLRNFFNSDYLKFDSHGDVIQNGFLYNAADTNYNTILQIQDDWVLTYDSGTVAIPRPFVVQALPGFGGIPFEERAYQFGSSTPFPVPTNAWKNCTYFWTALGRLNPVHRNIGWNGPIRRNMTPPDLTNGIIPSSSYSYDIYILVFRKGAVEQRFSMNGPTGKFELPNTRMAPNAFNDWMLGNNGVGANVDVALVPSVDMGNYIVGAYSGGGSWSTPAQPGIGQVGIGAVSGTVFRQLLSDTTLSNAEPRPDLMRDSKAPKPIVEPVIYSPAPDGSTNGASPLIYIYQTTMTF